MALKTRTELKAFFETGDFPTESQFADLIDSSPNYTDDDLQLWYKVSKVFSDWQPSGTKIKSVPLISIPSGKVLTGIIGRLITPFSGQNIASVKGRLYNYSFDSNYISDFIMSSGPGISHNGFVSSANLSEGINTISTDSVLFELQIFEGLGKINDLSAGFYEFYFKLEQFDFTL